MADVEEFCRERTFDEDVKELAKVLLESMVEEGGVRPRLAAMGAIHAATILLLLEGVGPTELGEITREHAEDVLVQLETLCERAGL